MKQAWMTLPVKLPHLEKGKKAVGEWPSGGENEATWSMQTMLPLGSVVSFALDAASMVYQAPVRPGVTEECQPDA